MQASCLTLLLSCFVELRDLLHEVFGHPVLLAGVTLETNEGEEAIFPLVLRLAICEAGKPAEPSPFRCARVGVVASRESLRGEGAQKLSERQRGV